MSYILIFLCVLIPFIGYCIKYTVLIFLAGCVRHRTEITKRNYEKRNCHSSAKLNSQEEISLL